MELYRIFYNFANINVNIKKENGLPAFEVGARLSRRIARRKFQMESKTPPLTTCCLDSIFAVTFTT